MEKLAACCFIQRPGDGSILAVSRGRTVHDWGLPGGSVEPGEPVVTGAERELWEETGVKLGHDAYLAPIAEGPSFTHFVTIFEVVGDLIFPGELKSVPFEGYVAWVPPTTLIAPQCRFSDFQRRLFEGLGVI